MPVVTNYKVNGGDNGSGGTYSNTDLGSIFLTIGSGADGTSGSSGANGNNGNNGTSGTAGTSGANGNNGNNGTSGTAGTSGANGNDGNNGTSGTNGANGNNGTSGINGDKGGLKYEFDSNTSASGITYGYFRYNNGNIASVSQIYIHDGEWENVDVSSYLLSWDNSTSAVKGYIIVKSNTINDNTFAVFQLNSLSDGGSYVEFNVTYISGNIPSNTEACVIEFCRTGNDGNNGNNGTNGTSGANGNNGNNGTSGSSGEDGTSGVNGNNGNNGTNGTSGTSGANGNNGNNGTSGVNGINGDRGGLKYEFNSTTNASGLTYGYFRYNSGTISSVSQIYIHDGEWINVDVSNYLLSWDDSTASPKGYIIVKSNTIDDATLAIFQLNSINDGGSYVQCNVTYVSGNIPDNGEACVIEFYRTGNNGNNGTSGTSGANGNNGNNGTSGTSGANGNNGNNGDNGTSGTSGANGNNGNNGTSGTSGANGNNGNNGTSGTSGTSPGSTPTFTSVAFSGNTSCYIDENWGLNFHGPSNSHPARFERSVLVGSFASYSGNTDYGQGDIYATGTLTENYSDRRLKTNIKTIANALAKIKNINGVTFNPNIEKLKSLGVERKPDPQVGLLADEVKAILPEVVSIAPFDIGTAGSSGMSKSGEDYLTIKYELLVPLLVEAIKELAKEIELLKAQKNI